MREAARQGLTQKQIAQLIGRSQPEVSLPAALSRPKSSGALRLRRHSREVRHLIDQAGGSNPGISPGCDGCRDSGSDVDLAVRSCGTPMGLIELGALERRLSELLGASVELVPASASATRTQRDRVSRGGYPCEKEHTGDSEGGPDPL